MRTFYFSPVDNDLVLHMPLFCYQGDTDQEQSLASLDLLLLINRS